MFCPDCGNQVSEGAGFCTNCGKRMDTVYKAAPEVTLEKPEHPMNWYKFLIWFSLFAGAVLNVINGFSLLSGSTYQGYADLVYSAYPGLQGFDVVMGLCLLALAAYGVYVRFQLSGYKENAPKKLLGLYAASIVYNLVYAIGVNSIVTGMEVTDMGTIIGTLVGNGIMIYANYVYFKKREDLFVN